MPKHFTKFLQSLSTKPGVYQMIDKKGDVLYVGKAKNLKNRVSSYFSGKKDLKTSQMVSQIVNIEITVTHSEQEAYILENSLIKQIKPKYNIVFRDDKTYPFIKISLDDYPSLRYYRANELKSITDKKTEDKKNKNKILYQSLLFGPYPNINSVKESIDIMQKTFKLRNCSNTTFRNRTRPCLQYQIKRCSAPCVNLISKDEYAQDVENAKTFLKGKTNDLIENLINKMDTASIDRHYEVAAKFRDQISALKGIQKEQSIITKDINLNIDVISLASKHTLNCFHLLCVRGGKVIGSRQYFLQTNEIIAACEEELFSKFIMQHYLNSVLNQNSNINLNLPNEILISKSISNAEILEKTLYEILNLNRKIKISFNVKTKKAKWLEIAHKSAHTALVSELANQVDYNLWFNDLMQALNITFSQVACVDISHSQGIDTVGAIVVFTETGPKKSSYRRFNIKTTSIGDDYQAIREVLERYVVKMKNLEEKLPELILIDGGKGQLKIAEEVFEKFAVEGVKLLAIAKGPLRKSGVENIFTTSHGDKLNLKANPEGFLLLQHVRDEAHRFAITGHRRKQIKRFKYSALEDIPGIGENRRKTLLSYFGGMQEIMAASVDELALVPGVSKKLAIKIYEALHGV